MANNEIADIGGSGSTDRGSTDTTGGGGGTAGGGRGPRFDDDPTDTDGGVSDSDGGGGGTIDEIRERVSTTVSGASDTVSDAAEPVTSRVDTVSDALPGRTGEAFAAGVGVAAIPEPTPVTEGTGAAIAGGAALVGGGVLASRALRNRGSELGIGDRVSNELDVGQSRRDATEVSVGSGAAQVSELEPGSTSPVPTEVGIGSATSAEIDVPGATGGSGLGSFDFAQQIGIGEPQQTNREQTTTITGEDIEDLERTSDLEEDEQLRQIREELQRRQEFVREGNQPQAPTRDPVRFPADEAATGTATGLAEQLEPDFDDPARSLGTAAGAGSITDEFLAGGERADSGSEIGQLDQLNDPTSLANTSAPGMGTGVGDTTGTTGETDVGGTDVGGGTGTGTQTSTAIREEYTIGTQAATEAAQPQATQTQEQLAQAEQAVFEPVMADPVATGTGTGQGNRDRDRPREEFPGDGSDDDNQSTAFGSDESLFGSGVASADDLLDEFERL